MARNTLVPVACVDEGAVLTLASAPVDGDSIPGGGDVRLIVKNGSGSSIDVTVQTAATTDGLAVADQVVAVAAGAQKVIGPFRPATYDRASGDSDPGRVWVDYSAVSSVTRHAIQG